MYHCNTLWSLNIYEQETSITYYKIVLFKNRIFPYSIRGEKVNIGIALPHHITMILFLHTIKTFILFEQFSFLLVRILFEQ